MDGIDAIKLSNKQNIMKAEKHAIPESQLGLNCVLEYH